jgi:hypothetical protein
MFRDEISTKIMELAFRATPNTLPYILDET